MILKLFIAIHNEVIVKIGLGRIEGLSDSNICEKDKFSSTFINVSEDFTIFHSGEAKSENITFGIFLILVPL